MALVKCKECGQEVSKSAKQCPNCGYDNRGWWGRRNIASKSILSILIFFMGLLFFDIITGTMSIDEIRTWWTENPNTSSDLTLQYETSPKTFPYSKPKFPNNLQDAMSDYQWRFDLVEEQTTRLDMLYIVKSGEFMSCKEYSAWLDDLESYTEEFVKRNKDALYSGQNYANLLNTNVENLDYEFYRGEYNRVVKNNQISKSDIEIAINNFNGNVEIYNQRCAT